MIPGHPLFKSSKALRVYLLIWLLVALLQSILTRQQGLPWQSALGDATISCLLFSLIAFGFWYPCRYISLEETPLMLIMLNHSLAACLAAGIWLGSVFLFLPLVADPAGMLPAFFEETLNWRFSYALLFYFLTISFYYLQLYYSGYQEQLLQESELRILARESELRALKLQINPHFLFNSLNSINALLQISPERASTMTVKLGSLLRSSLAASDATHRPLRQELAAAKLYLEIEQERFADRIRYSETIDPKTLDMPVPVMCLQPLLENAVKHAVQESLSPIRIHLTLEKKAGYLRLHLENDLPEGTAPGTSGGIGLSNIAQRLELLYQRKQLLSIATGEQRFGVTLRIPLEESRHA